jgi:hyperosmotically inducible protein
MIRNVIVCLICILSFTSLGNATSVVLSDAYITAKVETAVLKAKILDDESIPIVGINATTKNGVVTLTGVVKNTPSIVAIVKRVSHIRGVKKIISKLQVKVHD